MDKAIKAGGKEAGELQDDGFMFVRSFEDPDGQYRRFSGRILCMCGTVKRQGNGPRFFHPENENAK